MFNITEFPENLKQKIIILKNTTEEKQGHAKRATYGDVVLDTVRPVLGRRELPRHGHGDPVMHRPGQSDHPSHRVVLRQRRVDDVVTATTDHTVAPAGGQDVPVERDNHPHATNVVPVRPVGVWGSLKAVKMLKKK